MRQKRKIQANTKKSIGISQSQQTSSHQHFSRHIYLFIFFPFSRSFIFTSMDEVKLPVKSEPDSVTTDLSYFVFIL